MRENVSVDKSKRSFGLLWIFLVIVFLLIAISLSIKVIQTVKKSSFDGSHRFVFLLIEKDQNELISVEPGVNALRLSLAKDITKKELAAKLSVPVEGVVTTENSITPDDQLPEVFVGLALNPKTSYDFITVFDLLRLYFVTSQIPKREIQTALLSVKSTSVLPIILKKYFADRVIVSENQMIALENGSGVTGLGQKLEETVELLGGNVISVTTSREVQQPTYIFYSGKKTYTIRRLEKLLHQQAEEGNTGAADILVIVGKRSLSSDFFAKLRI